VSALIGRYCAPRVAMDAVRARCARGKAAGDAMYDVERYIAACAAYDDAVAAIEEALVLTNEEEEEESRSFWMRKMCVVKANRAACLNKRQMPKEAIEDCDCVIAHGGVCAPEVVVKAFYRRGCAFERMGDADAAIASFEYALQIEPTNEMVRLHLKKFKCVFHRACVLHKASPEVLARQTKFRNFTSRPNLRHMRGE
jgi:tetratricopeptide (TPR) repeat protein